jgi:hypothetical protein
MISQSIGFTQGDQYEYQSGKPTSTLFAKGRADRFKFPRRCITTSAFQHWHPSALVTMALLDFTNLYMGVLDRAVSTESICPQDLRLLQEVADLNS